MLCLVAFILLQLCQEERTYYSTVVVLPCSVGLLRETNVTVVLFQFRSKKKRLRPCLDVIQIPNFFTLSITSIFSRLHGVLNVGKKITNYIV
jgi:hypothetical protein